MQNLTKVKLIPPSFYPVLGWIVTGGWYLLDYWNGQLFSTNILAAGIIFTSLLWIQGMSRLALPFGETK